MDTMQLQHLFNIRQRKHQDDIDREYVALFNAMLDRRDAWNYLYAQCLVLALLYGKGAKGK